MTKVVTHLVRSVLLVDLGFLTLKKSADLPLSLLTRSAFFVPLLHFHTSFINVSNLQEPLPWEGDAIILSVSRGGLGMASPWDCHRTADQLTPLA